MKNMQMKKLKIKVSERAVASTLNTITAKNRAKYSLLLSLNTARNHLIAAIDSKIKLNLNAKTCYNALCIT